MKKRHGHRSGRVIILALFIVLCASSGYAVQQHQAVKSSASSTTAKTRTIVYYGNQRITVPAKIDRIAVGWPAQNSIVAMLGYGDKIVATMDMIKANPTFGKFMPSIKKAVVCFLPSGEINSEGLLTARPEIAFLSSAADGQRLKAMGIPVASLKSNSMNNLIERTVITGRILGDDAHLRALQYVRYYNDNVRKVVERISRIPHSQRLTVYHTIGSSLSTAGSPSLVQDWMDLAGAVNVAKNWNVIPVRSSGQSNTNLEQVIAANPAVIVCMNAADAKTIKTDPRWMSIRAVKEGRVYVNPKGMFFWCRETSEEALQFLWLAKNLYPNYLRDIDMVAETKYFYKTFYGYNLTDHDVQMFLNPQ